MSNRYLSLLVAPLLLLLTGCPTKKDPLACQGDCSHQSVKSFCDIDGVYPASELPNECIAPPSADACNRVETCSSLDKPYCTDESMGECVECLTGDQCDGGEVCDAESHACVVLACTPGAGGDSACAGADPSLPFCGPGESCVACLVSADCAAAASAVCDAADFECRGCASNGECDSKVCAVDTGVCADPADVVYVSEGGTDGGACGTQASPCATITEGLGKVTGGRDTVVIGAGDYIEKLSIIGKTVALVGDGEVNINPGLADAEFAVNITGNSNVSMDGIDIALADGGGANSIALRCAVGGGNPSLSFTGGTISGSGGIGVSASACSLSVTGSTISGNSGLGVTSSGGSLSVTGSTISGNSGGGIEITNSDFTIVNNFIVNNGLDGDSGSDKGGVSLSSTDGQVESFAFNTLSGNGIDTGAIGGSSITCSSTNLSASSNIIVAGGQGGGGGLIVGGSCDFSYSLIEGAMPFAGIGNKVGDPKFVNAGEGNYRIQAGSPGIDAADPAATLDVDIDGEARPQGAGHDMGADEAG